MQASSHESASFSQPGPGSVVVSSPSAGLRFQFDAAVRADFSVAAAICLPPSNTILAAQTEFHNVVTDPLKAEASAAFLAAQLASTMHPTSAVLEGDSSIVTVALRKEEFDMDWSISNIISNSVFSLSSISH